VDNDTFLPKGPNMEALTPVVLVLGLLLGGSLAAAQGLSPPGDDNSRPILGGAGVLPPTQLPSFSGSQNATVRMHSDPTGKPCVKILGYAQQQVVNKNIFDHMISASNNCSQTITVHVCYYQSQHCTSIDVPAYGRKEALLGIMPAMKDFRFEYTEKFDQGSVFGGAGFRFY